MSYRTILVGLDGSPAAQRALDAALEVARRDRARLLIAGVVPFPEDALDSALHWRTRAAFARAVEAAVDLAQRKGVRAVPHLLDGSPAEELLWLAESAGADLLVIGSWGKSLRARAARVLLGSVAKELATRASCSVLIVR
jgi:nucleotide-binding universal stress UspA family protein